MEHPGVTCPTCGSWKSPKKMFRSAQVARDSINHKHSTVCKECTAEYTYTPIVKSRKRFGIFGRVFQKVKIEDMVVVKEGTL